MNSVIEKWLCISFSSDCYQHVGFRLCFKDREGRFRLYQAENSTYSSRRVKTSHVFVWEIGIFWHNFLTEGWQFVVIDSTVLVAQETALEAPERKTWHKSSIVLGWCLQGFGTVYMRSHAMDDVLDPVLQQFYLSSSFHSSSVFKVSNNLYDNTDKLTDKSRHNVWSCL